MPNAYPCIFSLTALGSLLWLGWSRSRRGRPSDMDAARGRLDAGAAGLAGGLAGARLGYVAWHLGYFRLHPAETLAYWQGGLDWFGGVLGALLGVWVFSRAAGRPFLETADTLAIPGLVLSVSAWLGCWIDGCAYGRTLPAAWWAPASPDSFGTIAPRWPTQPVALALSLLFLAIALRLESRLITDGLRACVGLAMVAVVILLASAVRGDAAPALFGLRGDAIASAFLLVAAILAGRRLGRTEATS